VPRGGGIWMLHVSERISRWYVHYVGMVRNPHQMHTCGQVLIPWFFTSCVDLYSVTLDSTVACGSPHCGSCI
jgi:hypothetical protein